MVHFWSLHAIYNMLLVHILTVHSICKTFRVLLRSYFCMRKAFFLSILGECIMYKLPCPLHNSLRHRVHILQQFLSHFRISCSFQPLLHLFRHNWTMLLFRNSVILHHLQFLPHLQHISVNHLHAIFLFFFKFFVPSKQLFQLYATVLQLPFQLTFLFHYFFSLPYTFPLFILSYVRLHTQETRVQWHVQITYTFLSILYQRQQKNSIKSIAISSRHFRMIFIIHSTISLIFSFILDIIYLQNNRKDDVYVYYRY